MALDRSVIGAEQQPEEWSWDSTDSILYSLGVGAGLGNPLSELEFTAENCEGITQKVLPTFGAIVARTRGARYLGEYDRSKLVHAGQSIEVYEEIPVKGRVRTVWKVLGMYDKGSGALVVTESVASDLESGKPLVRAVGSNFIRGEGGFGRESPDAVTWERPDREPDHRLVMPTRSEQALLYRLSGDRNPLHVDPQYARRGGFAQPILHGMCTYGVTGRALLYELCDSDPARFCAMSGRFTSPVFPGENLAVSIWRKNETEALFQTAREDGTVVIDRGSIHFRAT